MDHLPQGAVMIYTHTLHMVMYYGNQVAPLTTYDIGLHLCLTKLSKFH